MTKKKKVILIFILLITIFSISYFLYRPQNKTAQVNLAELSFRSEISGSVYDLLKELKINKKIDFKEKYYPGMGVFIEEINGIKNTREKNWIYYINGEKAQTGVSNLKINLGDIVSWKFEQNY